MATGVRAEVAITAPTACGLADVAPDASIRSVSRTVLRDDGEVVAEFVAEDPVEGARKMFDYDAGSVYRLVEDADEPCVCGRIEQLGYPVRDHRVEDGTVTLAFFVPEIAELRTVVEELAGDGYDVSIRRLVRSGDADGDALVFVDKRQFTDRQLEVLRTADRMGYFEHPREANAGEVADALDIATATFTEHLSAAQRKLLSAVLDR